MASTNPKQAAALTQFYRKRILRLSTIREMDWLEHGEPESEASYFVPRERQEMSPQDFVLGLDDEHSAGETLERAWASSPLAGTGRDMIKLVRYFPPVEEESQVSAFVYEMF